MNFSKFFPPRLVPMALSPIIAFLASSAGVVVAGNADVLYGTSGNGGSQQAVALLDSGVDVNARTSDGSYASSNTTVENHVAIIRLLLDRGADPNVQNSPGDTPLIFATKYAGGQGDTVRLLIDAGTDLEIRDQEGKAALDYAEANRHDVSVSLLKSLSR